MPVSISMNVRIAMRFSDPCREIAAYSALMAQSGVRQNNKSRNNQNENASMKILILCTGNSCRSQMAEGFLKSFDSTLEVYSAGTTPASRVHPRAIRVMKEVGIDLSTHKPKPVDQYLDVSFDFVITVCDHAKETCPVFLGKVHHRLHVGFNDPAEANGKEEEILAEFRHVRNEIQRRFQKFYSDNLFKR
jgi:arsenate reductase